MKNYYVFDRRGNLLKYSDDIKFLKRWYNLCNKRVNNNSESVTTKSEFDWIINNFINNRTITEVVFDRNYGTTFLTTNENLKLTRYSLKYSFVIDFKDIKEYEHEKNNFTKYENVPGAKCIDKENKIYEIINVDSILADCKNSVVKIFYHINPAFSGKILGIRKDTNKGILSFKDNIF